MREKRGGRGVWGDKIEWKKISVEKKSELFRGWGGKGEHSLVESAAPRDRTAFRHAPTACQIVKSSRVRICPPVAVDCPHASSCAPRCALNVLYFLDVLNHVVVFPPRAVHGLLHACLPPPPDSPPVVCVKGELPPTINYETPDPECDLRIFGEKVKVEKVKGALSSNLVRRTFPLPAEEQQKPWVLCVPGGV